MVLDRGYKGLKLKVWRRSDEDVALVREVRQAVGDTLTIYVDANSKYTESEVRTILAKIADYRVDFIEDPCRSADLTRMAHAGAGAADRHPRRPLLQFARRRCRRT